MKNKIFNGIAALALAGSMISCSSDYLEQPPIDSVTDVMIGQSIEAARAALYGVCESMYIGTYETSIRMANGEAYLQTYYGDSASPDAAFTWLYGFQYETQAWVMMPRDNGAACAYPWMYAYNIINQSNQILKYIDEVPGNEAERDFIKAQALTLRAHAYIRLMQVYGPRYEDSNNGQELCVILRLTPGTENLPLSNYAECIAQIYDDLDNAIDLYNGSSVQRTRGFEPNLAVAQGLYSRIALINHDWQKAFDMAKAGRADFPIMTAEDYKKGFAEHNAEWLWYNESNFEYNGYNSWGASFSANGAYACAYDWSGSGAISYKFYKQVYDKNQDDVRCELFFTPDKATKFANTGVKEADFWSEKSVFPDRLTCYGVGENMSAAASIFVSSMTPAGFTGGYVGVDQNLSIKDAGNIVARRKWYNDNVRGQGEGSTRLPFGGQVKFWSSTEDLGDSEHPFLRGAELLLNQAEAALELASPDLPTAKSLLEELNSKRMSNYVCNASTVDEMKEEVRLYRRMELWGEGDTWFSMKRWNIGVEKEIWEKGNVNSNNFVEYYKGTYPADYSRGWRYAIPRSEINYNTIINGQLNGANL